MASLLHTMFLCVLLLLLKPGISSSDANFTFNGFRGANLSLHYGAVITPNGLLRLTLDDTKQQKGQAFYPVPITFKGSPPSGKVSSFATTFVFAIDSQYPGLGGNGLAFFISRSGDLSSGLPTQYLGLFNDKNNGDPSNQIFAIELDTVDNPEFEDIDDNHVGIDVNGLRSVLSRTAGYFVGGADGGQVENLILASGDPMQVWVYFDGEKAQLDVTLSPLTGPRPARPLLSTTINLTDVISDVMYVGFSSSTGPLQTSHYILGWSFQLNKGPQAPDLSNLPSLPRKKTRKKTNAMLIWLPLCAFALLLAAAAAVTFIVVRRIKVAELVEDWELENGPRRFSYKDLFEATRGFKDKELLGIGGFGRVYRGVLPSSNAEVAVKRVSHDSSQGMKQFVAEIVSIGRLRHRNLVQLLGYCRRKEELLLVYDFMPNGSLDRYLFGGGESTLGWSQRFRVIKGVASGLLYLHGEWEKVVIHRDIKASNVLLDGELNGRLGDFGLSRLHEHGSDPQPTRVVGTLGYLAPELTRAGRVSTASDVFAFGAFLLEVACGRRPIELKRPGEEQVLVDWVCGNWQRGQILETRDGKLGEEYVPEEVELVLKLGLLCLHPVPAARPSMRQVVQFLAGDVPLPEMSPEHYSNQSTLATLRGEGSDEYVMSITPSLSSASVLCIGR